MRVLVTGAQGCIGAWIVKQLLERSIEVVVYDLDPEPRRLSLIASPEQIKHVSIETGSIEDTARVKALVRDVLRGLANIRRVDEASRRF